MSKFSRKKLILLSFFKTLKVRVSTRSGHDTVDVDYYIEIKIFDIMISILWYLVCILKKLGIRYLF